MSNPPEGERVPCPACDNTAWAIIPEGSEIVEKKEDADGKVRVNCRECESTFLVYYQSE